MNPLLPVLLPLVIVVATDAQAAASPPPNPVNPLTGQPVAFETTQRRLEQMRLETQLLEEEAKQAAIRNNMSLAPIRRVNEERRLQAEMFGPGVVGATSPGALAGPAAGPGGGPPPARASRRPDRPQVPAHSSAREPSSAAAPMPGATVAAPAPSPQVLAILRNGDQRRAIVQLGATSTAVSEGDEWMGRRIGTITDGAVVIDGTTIDLPRHPAVIVASDRRPPPGQPTLVPPNRGQPAMASASAANPGGAPAGAAQVPASAQPFPPLPPLPSVPVIGPVDPRNPLSALGPQPAGFTPMSPMPPRPVPLPTVPAGDGPR
jgi:hypothetical protein